MHIYNTFLHTMLDLFLYNIQNVYVSIKRKLISIFFSQVHLYEDLVSFVVTHILIVVHMSCRQNSRGVWLKIQKEP